MNSAITMEPSHSKHRAADLTNGLLLVVHGTRDRVGVAEAHRALEMVAERMAPRPVELGFIELAKPSIAEAVARLVQRRVRQFTVAPLMLFAAAHVKQDIPRMVADGLGSPSKKGPGTQGPDMQGSAVQVRYADVLDCHAAVLEASAARFAQQATQFHQQANQQAEQTDVPEAADTLLLLVGRGSGDRAAIGRFEEFARRRRQLTPVADLRVCYVAVASPSFEEAITAACSGPQGRIVVQPHLLFQGRLIQQLKERIARCQIDDTARKWFLCQHLGPSRRIVDAVVDRVADVERRTDETGTI
jgi:sirohydrochlorin ferrochelatase